MVYISTGNVASVLYMYREGIQLEGNLYRIYICIVFRVYDPYTLINKSLYQYGDSLSNGVLWKRHIDLATPLLIDIENAKSSMDVEGPFNTRIFY